MIDESIFLDWPRGCLGVFAALSPPATNALRLQRIAEELAASPDPDQRWFSDHVQEYLAGAARGLTLDRAFGVEPMSFTRPWWQELSSDQRDTLIIELSTRVPAASVSGLAKAMATIARRYAATGWPREEHLPEPLPSRSGTPEEICWRLHTIPGKWPLAWRSILDRLQSADLSTANSNP